MNYAGLSTRRSAVAIGPWSHSSRGVVSRQLARVNPALVSLPLRGRRSKLPASKATETLAAGRVVGVNVRELLEDWPPRKWAAEDDGSALTSDPATLRILWFSMPDADGWFRLTATDSEGRSWSTYCRTPAHIVWHALENALAVSLQQSLDVAGDVELGSVTRAPPT